MNEQDTQATPDSEMQDNVRLPNEKGEERIQTILNAHAALHEVIRVNSAAHRLMVKYLSGTSHDGLDDLRGSLSELLSSSDETLQWADDQIDEHFGGLTPLPPKVEGMPRSRRAAEMPTAPGRLRCHGTPCSEKNKLEASFRESGCYPFADAYDKYAKTRDNPIEQVLDWIRMEMNEAFDLLRGRNDMLFGVIEDKVTNPKEQKRATEILQGMFDNMHRANRENVRIMSPLRKGKEFDLSNFLADLAGVVGNLMVQFLSQCSTNELSEIILEQIDDVDEREKAFKLLNDLCSLIRRGKRRIRHAKTMARALHKGTSPVLAKLFDKGTRADALGPLPSRQWLREEGEDSPLLEPNEAREVYQEP